MPKKKKGDPMGNIFSQKSLAMTKKLKDGPFGLVRYCMLRGKPFWFSSLSQQGQFIKIVELLVDVENLDSEAGEISQGSNSIRKGFLYGEFLLLLIRLA